MVAAVIASTVTIIALYLLLKYESNIPDMLQKVTGAYTGAVSVLMGGGG